jgi:hypothetical protein
MKRGAWATLQNVFVVARMRPGERAATINKPTTCGGDDC